jgi:hypothetical protein
MLNSCADSSQSVVEKPERLNAYRAALDRTTTSFFCVAGREALRWAVCLFPIPE